MSRGAKQDEGPHGCQQERNQESGHGRIGHPRSHQTDIMHQLGVVGRCQRQPFFVHTLVVELGNMLYGTEGDAEIRTAADEVGRTAVHIDKPHASNAKEDGGEFVADEAQQDVESLHTAQNTCIFEHARHTGFLMVLFCRQ